MLAKADKHKTMLALCKVLPDTAKLLLFEAPFSGTLIWVDSFFFWLNAVLLGACSVSGKHQRILFLHPPNTLKMYFEKYFHEQKIPRKSPIAKLPKIGMLWLGLLQFSCSCPHSAQLSASLL